MVNYKQPSADKRYNLWGNMNTRCYNTRYHETRPGYAECSICDEWLDGKAGRQKFYEWVNHNYYVIDNEDSVQLDKDILVPGNKVYSPDTCIFVPKRINDLFTHIDGYGKNGLPVGVRFNKNVKKYQASISKNSKNVNLGYYDTPEEASAVYRKHKSAEIIAIADEYQDVIPEKLYKAMIHRAELLLP